MKIQIINIQSDAETKGLSWSIVTPVRIFKWSMSKMTPRFKVEVQVPYEPYECVAHENSNQNDGETYGWNRGIISPVWNRGQWTFKWSMTKMKERLKVKVQATYVPYEGVAHENWNGRWPIWRRNLRLNSNGRWSKGRRDLRLKFQHP
jgi:hypothetical protein